jgi:hypothetical protein
MNPFDALEKLISEHGSATIIGHNLSFVREQYGILEKKVSDLEANLEVVTLDRNKKSEELQRLQDEHSDEIRIHSSGIEFKRGKRTSGKWLPFCPKCKMPAITPNFGTVVECSARCSWKSTLLHSDLNKVIKELS